MKQAMTDFLMTADAARLAGVTPATVRLWERSGKLRAYRTPSQVRVFLRPDVEALIGTSRRQQPAHGPAEATL